VIRQPAYFRATRDGRERWLISYTDILTLLLILFIAMAAQAIGQLQAQASEAAAKPSLRLPVAAPAMKPPADESLQRAAQQLKSTGLDLRTDPRGLIISLPQAVLFNPGNDRITAVARPVIAEIAAALRQSDNRVELAGHADSTAIHSRRFRDNWELSAARGLSLLKVLSTEYGIDESRLTISSHGAYSPKDSNTTARGRAENRRVEILILNSP
jgi:chemotaxis protein MotB